MSNWQSGSDPLERMVAEPPSWRPLPDDDPDRVIAQPFVQRACGPPRPPGKRRNHPPPEGPFPRSRPASAEARCARLYGTTVITPNNPFA